MGAYEIMQRKMAAAMGRAVGPGEDLVFVPEGRQRREIRGVIEQTAGLEMPATDGTHDQRRGVATLQTAETGEVNIGDVIEQKVTLGGGTGPARTVRWRVTEILQANPAVTVAAVGTSARGRLSDIGTEADRFGGATVRRS